VLPRLSKIEIVDRNKGIDVRKIPKPEFQDTLPLGEAAESDPGIFELEQQFIKGVGFIRDSGLYFLRHRVVRERMLFEEVLELRF
jgi:hypothetical protein